MNVDCILHSFLKELLGISVYAYNILLNLIFRQQHVMILGSGFLGGQPED